MRLDAFQNFFSSGAAAAFAFEPVFVAAFSPRLASRVSNGVGVIISQVVELHWSASLDWARANRSSRALAHSMYSFALVSSNQSLAAFEP